MQQCQRPLQRMQVWSSPNLAAHMTRAFSVGDSHGPHPSSGVPLDSHALQDAFDRFSSGSADMDRAMSMDGYCAQHGKLPALGALCCPVSCPHPSLHINFIIIGRRHLIACQGANRPMQKFMPEQRFLLYGRAFDVVDPA